MAFMDFIAYLVIKIRTKSKLLKQPYSQRLSLVKIEKPQNTQLPQNNEPKKMPKQPKTIWPELNPKTT